MYIKNISIQNFRCFEKLTVNFSEGINLLIGDNGAGKTSLLEALSVVLGAPFAFVPEIEKKYLDNKNVRSVYSEQGETTYSLSLKFPQALTSKCEWMDGNEINIEIYKNGAVDGQQMGDYFIASDFQKILNDSAASLPLFCYQNFDRDWDIKSDTSVERYVVETGKTLRIDGYKGCFGSKELETKIQAWSLKMLVLGSQRKNVVHEFHLFQDAIKQLMQIMLELDADIKVEYSLETKGMELVINGERESIYNLSTGYRAILYMIMELSYRASILNPDMKNFSELSGVVLIDEIDAHLHPKWQWKVLEAIRAVFPKVQFIIATHSPIVISSARNARILKLIDYSTVKELESAYGYTADEVIEFRQGSTARIPSVIQKKEEIEDAINVGDIATAEEILNSVKKEFGETSHIYNDLSRFLRINAWLEDQE